MMPHYSAVDPRKAWENGNLKGKYRPMNAPGASGWTEHRNSVVVRTDGNSNIPQNQSSESLSMVSSSGSLKELQPRSISQRDEDRSVHSSSDDRSRQKKIPENRLDSSFAVRNRDYQKFFKIGRVFTTLWTESYSGSKSPRDSFVNTVVYGEQVHSKIRRFVVVRKNELSCVCLPITVITPTSQKLQTINVGEHGIMFSNTMPQRLGGIIVPPVRVQATKGMGLFRDYTLVDYARPCTIETNVKVKDIGKLDSDSRAVLIANFKQIFTPSAEAEVPGSPTSQTGPDEPNVARRQPPTTNIDSKVFSYVASDQPTSIIGPPQQGENVAFRRQSEDNSPAGPDVKLDAKFLVIGQPERFYKVGRVFKTLWSEPAGGTAKDVDRSFYTRNGLNELVFSKVRRFVVVRERVNSCLCLPLYTYGGQGSSKPEVRAEDHVSIRLCATDRPTTPQPTNEGSQKQSLGMIIEVSEEKIDPMTRINLGQVFTIQHNLKVAKVGRIHPADIERLKQYFVESVTA